MYSQHLKPLYSNHSFRQQICLRYAVSLLSDSEGVCKCCVGKQGNIVSIHRERCKHHVRIVEFIRCVHLQTATCRHLSTQYLTYYSTMHDYHCTNPDPNLCNQLVIYIGSIQGSIAITIYLHLIWYCLQPILLLHTHVIGSYSAAHSI